MHFVSLFLKEELFGALPIHYRARLVPLAGFEILPASQGVIAPATAFTSVHLSAMEAAVLNHTSPSYSLHLRIVGADFPQPNKKHSWSASARESQAYIAPNTFDTEHTGQWYPRSQHR
jgi:hypothetical protein